MAATTECPQCEGTQWVQVSTPQGPASRRCDCFRKEQRELRLQQMGLPPLFADASFDTFSAGDYRTEPARYNTLIAALAKARRFAADFPISKGRGLLFHGGSPTKQTHLAVATLKCLVEKGFSGMYCEYHQLLLTLRARNDPNAAISGPSWETARRVASVDVLLLDSLGDHRATGWVLDTAGGIIKHRYFNQKCLIATTGFPLESARRSKLEGFAAERAYEPVPDSLPDRIGQEAALRLRDHCRSVSMVVGEPGPPGAPLR